MDFQQIRKYVKGVLTNSFLNKTTLDKLSTSNEGNLLFDGKEINNSSVEWNQIQTEGIKIAEVTIDGMATEIFAPNGGVGSGIVVDTLIDATITTTGSYDFSASIDNYDMLIVTGMTHINSSDYEQLNSLTIMKDDYYIEAGDGWSHLLNFSINGSSTRRIVFNFNDGKLNVVKIENAALKKIYGIKFITQQHNYSTEEKIVGKWIDGKNIYQKTYNTNNISLDVSKENIENIINGFVCIENDEENQIPLIPIISGENDKVLCSNETSWNGYIHYAWKLFNGYNGDETGSWGVNGVGNSSINWVLYRFDKPIIPKKCLLKNYSIYTQNATIEFQFSKNGEDWVTLGGPYDAREYNIAGEEKYYEFENNETYSYFRFYVIGCLNTVNGFICVDCVQVYGFETKYKKTISSDIITFESNNLVIDKPLNSMIKSVTIQYTKTTD